MGTQARVFHNPPPVSPEVAGAELVDTVVTEAHLGKLTWKIWKALIHNRLEHGRLRQYVTNRWLAKHCKTALNKIEAGMQRLRKAKILETEGDGWYVALVTKDGRKTEKKVFFRRCLGDWRDGQITFPKKSKAGLLRLCKKGGRRTGAGRRVRNTTMGQTLVNQVMDCDGTVANKVVYLHSAVGNQASACIEAVGNQLKDDCKAIQTGGTSNQTGGSLGIQTGGLIIEDNTIEISSSSYEEEKNARGANRCAGHFTSSSLVDNQKEVLPPYPWDKLFGLATTPNPPRIPDTDTDLQAVNKMVHAYRGAIEAWTKKKCFLYAKGDISTSKDYASLVAASKVLREHEIPPCAWASWSISYWKSYLCSDGKRASTPSLKFVFNATFIRDHHGHYGNEARGYMGGRTHFPKEWRDVNRRYQGMLHDLRVSRAETPEEEARVVEEWFPGGWEVHYERVKQAAAADRARMHSMFRRGVWLWR